MILKDNYVSNPIANNALDFSIGSSGWSENRFLPDSIHESDPVDRKIHMK